MKKRFSEEQLIGFLRQVEAVVPVKEWFRQQGFSKASFCTWRTKLGGMNVYDTKLMNELDDRNQSINFRNR